MMKSLDLQKFVIDYLNKQDFEDELEATTVGGIRPSTEENQHPYVLVLATGGAGLSHRILYTAQITIDSYARTTWWAGELARRVGDAIHRLPEADGPIAVVSSPAPAELPDPDTDMRRYTATYQITAKLGVTNG
nr:MAG TPA: tail completion protein [Caudoviricetes sp.]